MTPSPEAPAPAGTRRPRRTRTGLVLLAIDCALLLGMGLTPSPYVLRQPGPAFNAIGEVALQEGAPPVQVVTIEGAESFQPRSGGLQVMTVNIAGNPVSQPSWFEALGAYLDPSRDVLPVEAYYPPGASREQRDEQNRMLMESSQADAVAAALLNRGYEVPRRLTVGEVVEGAAAEGVLQAGDAILSAEGRPLESPEALTQFLADNGEREAAFRILRDGVESEVRIAPRITEVDGVLAPRLGVIIGMRYDFPVEVRIELGNVGGPSAGLVFSLSIIDKLTPGDLAADRQIAGTGTISPDGTVGAIGGIRQKLYAAEAIGAQAFLLPRANCAEALAGGSVPGEVPLYAVETLDEALAAVEHITSDGKAGARTGCEAAGEPAG